MLRGEVRSDTQALITIDILGSEGRSESVEAAIDTGFSGHLTLPADIINRLGLQPLGLRHFELATGERVGFRICVGSATWHGRPHEVSILESECDPLLGMALIWGSRITLDATVGGTVTIKEFASRPGSNTIEEFASRPGSNTRLP